MYCNVSVWHVFRKFVNMISTRSFSGFKILLISAGVLLSSFTITTSIDEVITALKSGNAAQLARYFDTRVDISLPNKSDNFSKNQAEMILKDFFCKQRSEKLCC